MNRRNFLGTLPFMPLAFSSLALANEPGEVELAANLAKGADRRPLHGLVIKNHENNPLPLTEHLGKFLVINLWGPWCVPCRREMPSLSRLHDRLKGLPVALLPVAFDRRGADSVRQFYETNKITNLPILTGDGENLHSVTGKSHLPLTLIADDRGIWILTVEGEAVWDDDATIRWLENLATA